MIKRKNTIIAALILGASLTMTGCSEADKVNYNMSKQADYFECERKITVYNARKANVQASMELYKTMVFTEDTLIEAKSTVATLRKLSKCLDDKRKDVKRRYMQPYEEFEDKIKELQQIIAEPIELIAQVQVYLLFNNKGDL